MSKTPALPQLCDSASLLHPCLTSAMYHIRCQPVVEMCGFESGIGLIAAS